MAKLNLSEVMCSVKNTVPLSENITKEQSNALMVVNQKHVKEAALAYARAGYAVIPVSSTNKKSIGTWKDKSHDYKNGLVDEGTVKDWWSNNLNAGIAMITGEVSGVFVVDIDEGLKDDGTRKNGLANFEALCDQHNYKPNTLTVRSAHGGYHLYYNMPGGYDLRCSENKLAKNIDIRANGGYVIVPPTILADGGKYETFKKEQVADAPQWLIDLIINNKSFPDSNSQSVHTTETSGIHPYAAKALKNECEILANTPEGQRNSQLNKSAFAIGQLIPGGYIQEGKVREELEQAALKTGMDYRSDGILATIDSGMKAGKENPRTIPSNNDSNNDDETNQSNILHKAPEVPIHVFPERIQSLLKETSEVTSTPISLSVAALLGMMAACLGKSIKIKIKEGFEAYPNLYVMIVGYSGIGKSPVSNIYFKYINIAEKEAYEKFLHDKKDFKESMEKYDRLKKQKNDDSHEIPLPPTPPIRKEYYIEKATLEATIDSLANNPRGILIKSDEFSSILVGRGRYTNGNTMEMTGLLNSAYDQSPFKSNTRTSRDVYLSSPCLSLYGEIQPDILTECISKEDQTSGFLPRCIIIRAEEEKPNLWNDKELSDDNDSLIEYMTNFLLGINNEYNFDPTDDIDSETIGFNQYAKEYFIKWYNNLGEKAYWSPNSREIGPYLKKCRIHGLKMMLMFHYLRIMSKEIPTGSYITEETTRNALEFTDYLVMNNLQIVGILNAKPEKSDFNLKDYTPIELRIMKVIITNEPEIASNGWKLPNKRLVFLVNDGHYEQLSNETIGRCCSKLHITSYRDKERGRIIPHTLIETFKRTIESIESVGDADVSGIFDKPKDINVMTGITEQVHTIDTPPSTTGSYIDTLYYPENRMVNGKIGSINGSTDITTIDFGNLSNQVNV